MIKRPRRKTDARRSEAVWSLKAWHLTERERWGCLNRLGLGRRQHRLCGVCSWRHLKNWRVRFCQKIKRVDLPSSKLFPSKKSTLELPRIDMYSRLVFLIAGQLFAIIRSLLHMPCVLNWMMRESVRLSLSERSHGELVAFIQNKVITCSDSPRVLDSTYRLWIFQIWRRAGSSGSCCPDCWPSFPCCYCFPKASKKWVMGPVNISETSTNGRVSWQASKQSALGLQLTF